MATSSLPCTLVAQVAFTAGGDVFHRLFTTNPHHFSNVTPGKIQKCDLHQGSFAKDGSIIEWKFTLDGKEQTAKQVLQGIDEEKKTASYKFIGGELLELYKSLLITFHVETKNGVDYITWTIEYELVSPDTPHPISLLQFVIEFTEEVEAHIFG